MRRGYKRAVDKYADRRYDIEREGAIDVAMLETIPFDYPDSATEVVYETDEFTFVCPWSGLPDFARLVVSYLPRHSLVELKSLKYYLTSYRNVGILQEHTVNRILHDLVSLLRPVFLMVAAECKERGGLKTKVTTSYDSRKNKEASGESHQPLS